MFRAAPSSPRQESGTTPRTAVAILVVAVLAIGSFLFPGSAAVADVGQAGLTIQKSATTSQALPGETFDWVVEVGCSVLDDECVDASLVDVIPPEFDVTGEVVVTPTAP